VREPAILQARSERKGEAYRAEYGEPLSDTSTMPGTGGNILWRELVGGANQPILRRTRL